MNDHCSEDDLLPVLPWVTRNHYFRDDSIPWTYPLTEHSQLLRQPRAFKPHHGIPVLI